MLLFRRTMRSTVFKPKTYDVEKRREERRRKIRKRRQRRRRETRESRRGKRGRRGDVMADGGGLEECRQTTSRQGEWRTVSATLRTSKEKMNTSLWEAKEEEGAKRRRVRVSNTHTKDEYTTLCGRNNSMENRETVKCFPIDSVGLDPTFISPLPL